MAGVQFYIQGRRGSMTECAGRGEGGRIKGGMFV